MKRRSLTFFLLDIISLCVSFYLFIHIKSYSFYDYLLKNSFYFIIFILLWIVISYFFKKYHFVDIPFKHLEKIKQIIIANTFIFGVTAGIIYFLQIPYFSRLLVLGIFCITTILDIIFSSLLQTGIISNVIQNGNSFSKSGGMIFNLNTFQSFTQKKSSGKQDFKNREETILTEIREDVYKFIFSYAKIDSPDTLIINTTSRFNIDTQLNNKFETIVNLKRINDIRYLNKFFESANKKLTHGGLYINYVETKDLRKKRILNKYWPVFNYLYYFLDYLIKRIFPKFTLTKRVYFFLTRGQNRVITKAETLGRLYSCGFEIIAEKFLNKHLYFVARKKREPFYPVNPTYGMFIKLERLGKYGKPISVYKLRTMHPYAEYLQEYIYFKEGLDSGGKFKSDFRVSTIGRILRTFWLDELPMLINLIKGDLKLFGVRPLSKHYFNLYMKDLQEKRIQFKPGLIPPFYVDNPKTLEEIMESEIKYLDAYKKHPLRTDISYFFIAVYNIIFKKFRSK